MPPPNTRLNPENSIAAKIKWLHIGGLEREYFSGEGYTNEQDNAFKLLGATEWGQGNETRNIAGQAAIEYPSSTLIDNPGSSWTIFYVGRVDLTAGNAPGLCSRRTTNATGYYGMYVNIAGANDDISLAANGGSLVLWNDSAISLRTGVPFVAVGIAVGTSDARLFVKYIDSPMQTATSSTTLTSGSGTHKVNIGQLSPDGERCYGVHMLGGFSTEAWSDNEAIEFVHNPFQIFKPKVRTAFADVPDDVRHVPIQVPWTKQPPPGTKLDQTNKFVKDLKFFCPFNEEGDQTNVVNGRRGESVYANGATGTKGHRATPLGKIAFIDIASTSDSGWYMWDWEHIPDIDNVPSKFSYMMRVKPEDAPHLSGGYLINQKDTSGSTINWGVFWTDDTGIGDLFIFRVNGTNFNLPKSSGDWRNTLMDIGFSNESGAGNLKMYAWDYATGDLEAATATGLSAVNSSSNPISIGGRFENNRGFDGEMYWAAMWHRVLTEGEMREFRENPWQIFEPRTIWAPINEALPDVANIDIERDTFPMKPPL
jgi:hypothetical protein